MSGNVILAVNKEQNILLFRTGVTKMSPYGTDWLTLSTKKIGLISKVSAAKGNIFALVTGSGCGNKCLFYREGITANFPFGTTWSNERIPDFNSPVRFFALSNHELVVACSNNK